MRAKPEDDVSKPDLGDRMFLTIGIFAAVFSVAIIYCHLFACASDEPFLLLPVTL